MPERGKISVLLVEHCSENLGWVEGHLSGFDIDLFWASSGSEAIGLARTNDFAMALLGVKNPEDGIKTAELILSDPVTQHLPLIFVCNGSAPVLLPLKGGGAGIVDYLTRPIEPVILQNKVQLFRELHHQRKKIKLHITELRKTHNQLRKGKERYIRLLASVTGYVYTVSVVNGKPVSTAHGQGCEAMTGFSPEEYSADPELWIRMIPAEDRPAVLDAAERILVAAAPLTIEHRIHHKDNTIHWVRNTLVPHFDQGGTPYGYDGIITDITERKLAELQLAKSVSLLEATLESTAEGILVVDGDGRITSCNRKFLSLWRIPDCLTTQGSDDELLAHEMCQLKKPEQFVEKLRYLYAHPEAESFDVLEFADGRLLERSSKPQMMGGEIVGRVWSFRDITEQKSLEEQLRQAQKMEAIGQMAGGIAHDFNNILTVVIGYGTQLQDNFAEDDPLRENIDQVLAAAERAANLTRSLLVFSRKQVMTPQVVDLGDSTRNMEKFLQRIIGADIQLRTDYSPECLMVYADSGQLEQVVMNLAANARDAMPNGGVLTLETQLRELDEGFCQTYGYGEPGLYALLAVSDSGSGMDGETCKRLFEPFFSTKDAGKGTGLGLSVVYGIVRQHKGYIKVYSELGVGSTFKILIPIFKGTVQSAAKRTLSAPVGGTETVLVADDDPAIRKIAESRLHDYGYKVLLAEDGVDAVRTFRENSKEIGLVVLDMLMPGMNGREVRKEILTVRPDAKMLFMSGYNQDMLLGKGLCESGSELLTKPFSPIELARKVREVLDKR